MLAAAALAPAQAAVQPTTKEPKTCERCARMGFSRSGRACGSWFLKAAY